MKIFTNVMNESNKMKMSRKFKFHGILLTPITRLYYTHSHSFNLQ